MERSACAMAVGAGAAGVAGVMWPFLPVSVRLSVSLIGTMTGGHKIRVLSHIEKVTIVPLEVAECLKEETVYSMQLIRRSMFGESNADDMKRGIKEVADNFDRAIKNVSFVIVSKMDFAGSRKRAQPAQTS
ncbi:hypothetical protein DAPPUDRAFT_113351 [Daphnia pulex]|uniref:Uncharacterized protein n=1 Tax=Daphnia pulex TaxID=6669 RepID=E9HET1_DAPPU|nr:hypothetical protein DAPPUDRAFT_113351 [Daphnia pulex]|eukprot:EFX69724.1 hypothetical protein DAPPUDRAFT_113351 [Daphnia pulex]